MITIVGTVPLPEKIYSGEAVFEGRMLKVGGTHVTIERGTGALIATVLRVLEEFGAEKPYCLLAGDTSSGSGSAKLLEGTISFLPNSGTTTLILHYMFILLKYGALLGESLKKMHKKKQKKPYVIADAGGMYLAKVSGIAKECDLFTPDHGELAFLADARAAHPMYTNPELLTKAAESLISMAWEKGNVPSTVIVKGKKDLVFRGGSRFGQVAEPLVPAMEAIGGTGDTVTGLVAAFQHLQVGDGITKALLINRLLGQRLRCTPRTQISEFIRNLDLSLLTKVGISL